MNQTFLALFLASFIASLALASPHHHHERHTAKISDNPSQEIIELMHKPMMHVKWAEGKDINQNFLQNMIPHHQGAIDASKALLRYTQNKRLKAMASGIITQQEREIKEFQALLPSLKEQKIDNPDDFNQAAKEIMQKMHQDMQKDSASGNVDRDYINAMIAHHQGAVEASKQILAITHAPEIKKIAQSIINSQSREIKDFQDLLKMLK